MAEILLVGASATGLMLACELRRYGVKLRVIDERSSFDELAEPLVFSAQAQATLKQMGLSDLLLQGAQLVSGVSLEIPQRDSVSIPFPQDQEVKILPRGLAEKRLTEELELRGVKVEWGTELIDVLQGANSVSVLLQRNIKEGESEEEDEEIEPEKIELNTSWILACDNDGERLRRYLGLENESPQELSTWAYAELRLKTPLPKNEAKLYLADEGPLFALSTEADRVFLRMSLTEDEEVLESPEAAEQESVPVDLKEKLRELIRQRIAKDQDVLEFVSYGSYEFQEQNLADYRHGRIVFLGSAACNSSPLSLNEISNGIEEVSNLAWKLALVTQGTGIEHILLDSYSRERRNLAQAHLDVKRGVELALLNDKPSLIKLRNSLLPLALKFPFVRRRIAENIFPSRGSYRTTLLNYTGEGVKGKGLRPGSALPNLSFSSNEGTTVELYSLFEGPEHLLLLFGNADKYREIKEATERAFKGLLRAYLIDVPENATSNFDLLDTQGESAEAFGLNPPFVVAVRPDAYIAYLGQGYSRARLLAHLGSYLQFQEEV